ncbi:acetate--CoA ligase family protein [Rhodobacteraceae bacterium D3-12]|nr:acetate--CoA ligase family protein [Rhodobacteraceae bacterium D3-12]
MSETSRGLTRFLRPRSIAVIGGGAWCHAVVLQSQKMGFSGPIWPVHPKADKIAGMSAYADIQDLPGPPDAVFIGVNRTATIDAVTRLASFGAGGAVCFASGFSEASAEDESGASLQEQLVRAAGDMPILGPNCYGFINALDGALLWPDQHGCKRVEQGVAILTQSSNIALNLTMQRRALPLAYTVSCGNMAQTTQAQIAIGLLDDPRVTAIGLHIEGFSDLRAWEALAHKAHSRGVPLIALKVGRSDQARAATVSHTASLAGGDAGAQAFLNRLGIPRLPDLPSFLETLKLLHVTGKLPSNRLASVSCSGGEASLMADIASGFDVSFPPLNDRQRRDLRAALGPKVSLANPLDYHTYIWRDTQAMTRTFAAITDPSIALTALVVDYPHTDASDWRCVTDAAIGVRAQTGTPVAVAATLGELLPEDTAQELLNGGVIPMHGLTETLQAAEAASKQYVICEEPVLLPGPERQATLLSEADAKTALAAHGLPIPRHTLAPSRETVAQAAEKLSSPLVLKGMGLAHKSEAGAVVLNLTPDTIENAAETVPGNSFLIEEMVEHGIAELLVGITRDPAHGFTLTLAAGGVLTELMADSTSLLVPSPREAVYEALAKLRIWPLLSGFRGKPPVNIDAVLDAVMAIQSYVISNAATVEEVEINPLICTKETAIAADALIRKAP